MKTPASELKRRARQRLKGKYGLCIGAQFAVYAAVFVILLIYLCAVFSLTAVNRSFFAGGSGKTAFILLQAVVFLSYVVALSLVGLLTPGINKIFLNLCTDQTAGFSDLLYAFRNRPQRFLGLYFVNLLIGLFWGIPYFVVMAVSIITEFIPVMILLLVLMYILWLAGIVFTMLFLSQSIFILIESPDKKVFASLKESADMMKGGKGRLLYLYLSFTGMLVLGYFSLGVGFLWIMPYIQCTAAEFYLDLKSKGAPQPGAGYEDASFEYMWRQENQ
ncbi:DUF975 family protein [Lachnospiraceae bacterium 54-53]